MECSTNRGFGIATALSLAIVLAITATASSRVMVVNGEALSAAVLEDLARVGTEVPPGRYWYDRISGLRGLEGGAARGRQAAGLPLPGPMRADASGGSTDVFMNGRALHPQEIIWLAELTGPVVPGRYWLGANGIGGFEAGEPAFDLRARSTRRGRRSIFADGPTVGGLGHGQSVGYAHVGQSARLAGN